CAAGHTSTLTPCSRSVSPIVCAIPAVAPFFVPYATSTRRGLITCSRASPPSCMWHPSSERLPGPGAKVPAYLVGRSPHTGWLGAGGCGRRRLLCGRRVRSPGHMAHPEHEHEGSADEQDDAHDQEPG